MSEVISGLLQIGLAQPANRRLRSTGSPSARNCSRPRLDSQRFAVGEHAAQWLVTVDSDQLVPLLAQIAGAWTNSGTNLSWRMLGPSTPLDQVAAPVQQQAPAAAQPAPGVLGSEPLPPGDLPTPPAGAPNPTGFAQ